MRNLQLRKRFVLQDNATDKILTASTWDGDSVIYACGPTKENPLLEIRRWRPANSSDTDHVQLVTSFDAPCPIPDLDCDHVLNIYFLPENSTICIILAGGDIVLVREDPLPGEEKIEIVGSVEVGLTAAEWSPDGELLVLTTRADTLLFMTRGFENSVSATLTEDDLKASKHVSVGWGKKETQFHGRGARALRDPTMPETVDEGIKSTFDDDATTISWRGDGQVFAVNSRQASRRRVIRVYTREGILDGVSEPVDNLEGALSWRPAGNLIAGIQRHKDKIDVVFFERNGLRHGDFPLRPVLKLAEGPDPTSSVSLKWNCDSSVLAVCLADRIQLWTMGNYHYYLKQEIITFKSSQSKRPTVEWDIEHPLKLLLNSGTSLEFLQYSKVVSRSTTWNSETGTVAVIDGQTLKLTSLRYANVPPPMAQEELSVGNNILAVSVLPVTGSELIAIVDMQKLYVYNWRPGTKEYMSPSLVLSQDLAQGQHTHCFRSLVFKDNTCVLILGFDGKSSLSKSVSWSKNVESPEIFDGTFQSSVSMITTVSASSEEDAFAICHSGSIEPINRNHNYFGDDAKIKIPKEPDSVQIIRLPGVNSPSINGFSDGTLGSTTAFSLTRNGGLFANGRCLTRDCTSFAVTSAHLVYTTSKSLLKFTHLGPVDELAVPPDTPEVDERCRAVERGARIVTVIQATSAVILQMPRGNLETTYPRALVLAEIRKSIDNKKYRKAFLSCRKQRVDMNIIYDYKPEQFLSNVELFVNQVQRVDYIDLFLSQLRDEDTCVSLYKDTLPKFEAEKIEAEAATSSTVTGKTKKICDAFLPVLRKLTSSNLQNTITAHVVKTPPDIDAGLREVAKLQTRGEKDGERAVEHICFLVDVNRLYDNALGLYDLKLTLLIAQRSQKDPGEYLPFLRRLHDLPELRRQFKINDYLDRHQKALADLWKLDEFEEFKQYTSKHNLYEDALNTCRYDETKYKAVMTLYAEWLQKRARHKDAGVALEYLQDYASAAESYQLAHMWRESLSCACIAPYGKEELHSLARVISDSLIELKDYQAAAIINRDYLQDPETAARLFCRGYHFSDAIALLSLLQRADLIPDIVDTGLMENMGSTTELLADCRLQLGKQVPRIRELRAKKIEQPFSYYEGINEGGPDIPDNISLAATDASTMGGSLFTRYTGKNSGTIATNATRKTAKNRRKEERKRAQGKKGSVYEEEYLVNSVGRLIERVNSVAEDVERLVVGLMRRSMREQARAVETAMREVIDMCSDCRSEVFQVEDRSADQGKWTPNVNGNVPPESESANTTEVSEPKRDPPTIRKWEGLALLGYSNT